MNKQKRRKVVAPAAATIPATINPVPANPPATANTSPDAYLQFGGVRDILSL